MLKINKYNLRIYICIITIIQTLTQTHKHTRKQTCIYRIPIVSIVKVFRYSENNITES